VADAVSQGRSGHPGSRRGRARSAFSIWPLVLRSRSCSRSSAGPLSSSALPEVDDEQRSRMAQLVDDLRTILDSLPFVGGTSASGGGGSQNLPGNVTASSPACSATSAPARRLPRPDRRRPRRAGDAARAQGQTAGRSQRLRTAAP